MKQGQRLAGLGTIVASLSAAAVVLTAAPRTSHAEQFILFDALFTYTKMDADNASPSHSHFYIRERAGNVRPVALVLNPMRPTNWMTPVNYRNGTVHIRTEVIDKPAGGEITQWTLCYIPVRGVPGGNGYGCTGSGTYTTAGIKEQDVSMTSWWENGSIDWTMGIGGMDLVHKDSNGGSGFTYLRPDSEKFFPTTMRITMIQVSQGATYDPSILPAIDGGLPPRMDSGTRDSGVIVDSSLSSDGATGAGGAGAGAGGAGSGGAGGASAGTGGSGPSSGSGGQATTGAGGDGSGGQGTTGSSSSVTTGPATTGTTTSAASGSGTTTGGGSSGSGSASPPAADAPGCNCSLERRASGSADLGYVAIAALSAFGASRRRRSRKPN